LIAFDIAVLFPCLGLSLVETHPKHISTFNRCRSTRISCDIEAADDCRSCSICLPAFEEKFVKLIHRSLSKYLLCLVFMPSAFGTVIAQSFSGTPNPLNQARFFHTSTLLNDGTVLVVGGWSFVNGGCCAVQAGAEIYSAAKGTFGATQGALNTARVFHTATLLGNGQVLIAGGGSSSNPLSIGELYNPTTGFFMETGSLNTARQSHTATLLNDGTVLITGGSDNNNNPLSSAEIYDPNTGAFTAISSMNAARTNHTATLLNNGEVLIVGGTNSNSVLTSAEIYNPSTRAFALTGSLAIPHGLHTSTLLHDGSVLVAGGFSSMSGGPSSSDAEIFNPASGTFATTGSLNTGRSTFTATALLDGTVLLAGGVSNVSTLAPLASAEIYNPSARTFSLTANLDMARSAQAATILSNGDVLITGGENGASDTSLSSADIYTYPLITGSLNPKYLVLAIVYAPPGASSSVSYSSSNLVGTSTSISNAFTTQTSLSLSLTGGFGIFGNGSSTTSTFGQSFTQSNGSSSTVSINATKGNSLGTQGTSNSALGIDHDNDIIYIWLNPVMNLTFPAFPNAVIWNGYSYDTSDFNQVGTPDVIGIPVFCLKNPFSTKQACTQWQTFTARRWDTPGLNGVTQGGLTLADYAQILSADPFVANPNYNPSTAVINNPDGSTSVRFQNLGQVVPYPAPQPNGGSSTSSGMLQYTATQQSGQTASTSNQTSFSIKTTASGDGFLGRAMAALMNATSFTLQDQWSSTQTNTANQTAMYTVVGPKATDNYSGPPEFDAYKDNVYGTFMFWSPLSSSPSFAIPPASIAFSAVSLTFSPTATVGASPIVLPVVLTNNSSVSMVMESPSISLSDPSFTVAADNCAGQTLQPGGNCSVSVAFSPAAGEVGSSVTQISGTMIAAGNELAPANAVVLITAQLPLSGTAVQPAVGNVPRAQGASSGTISTIIGNGQESDTGDSGPASNASVGSPGELALDLSNNLYVAGRQFNVVRKVTPGGIISTVVGTGATCSPSTSGCGDGGAATNAQLSTPTAVTFDSSGNMYIADTLSQRIRMVSASTGLISTIAGTGSAGFSGDGGPAVNAQLHNPESVKVDSAGNIYFCDTINQRVRMISASTGIISTIAGTGTAGSSGSGTAATSSELNFPVGLALDRTGNIYIADLNNNRIRRVAADTGFISTAAGNGTPGYSGDGGPAVDASLNGPESLATDAVGNVYISDFNNHVIRLLTVSTGTITTVVGNGTSGFSGDGGQAMTAQIAGAAGLLMDSSSNLYIADNANNRIRTVTAMPPTGCNVSGAICTVIGNGSAGSSGDGSLATNAANGMPGDLAADPANNIYVADRGLQIIRQIAPSGIISTVVGNGTACASSTSSCGDGGSAFNAQLNTPTAVAFDTTGNMYIADTLNQKIRKVSASTSIVTTIAGTGVAGFGGDGGLATAAQLHNPEAVRVDGAGNVYFSDSRNERIRKIDIFTGIISTIAGNGSAGFSGDGGPATNAQLNGPFGMALDSFGNIYIADDLNQRVRRVDANTGIISTVAGNGSQGYSGDGGPAVNATMNGPESVATDAAGNVYISDFSNHVIRLLTINTGIITTIAGNGTGGFTGDGGQAVSAEMIGAAGIFTDSDSNLYLSDIANNRVRKVTH
jgi:sugar lactone lactonase YvrE